MKSSNIRYLAQVDHLRAVAALWIVFYHGLFVLGSTLAPPGALDAIRTPTGNPLVALWAEGHTAVALFMTLSGFIFTVGTFGRQISYQDFIVNRILRIYPLYVLVMLITLWDGRHPQTLISLFDTLLPMADFNWAMGEPLVGMSWAVAVELQFYLLFPMLLRHLNLAPFRTVAALIGTALTLRLVLLGLGANPRDFSYGHLVGRLDQFVIGMLAAVLYLRWQGRETLFRALFCLALPGTVLLLWAFHSIGGGFNSEANWKVLWTTVEGGAWGAIILGYVGMRPKLPATVSRAVVLIGEMSFSIYLLHRVVLSVLLTRPWTTPRPFGRWDLDVLFDTACLAVPLTLAVSAVTFRVVERPFLSLRRTYVRAEVPAVPRPRPATVRAVATAGERP